MFEIMKISFQGKLVSIQPRIRLGRSFDEMYHNYLGYALRFDGTIGNEAREFTVGIGKAVHSKHQFQAELIISGECEPPLDSRTETVEFYKASKLKVLESTVEENMESPPWLGIPPELPVFRERGHRLLSAITYKAKCLNCIWGCHMPVEMIIDHWNPQKKRYRTETFCYGPKICRFYKKGPSRKVPGRKGMVYEEPDWIYDEMTAHREPHE